MYRRSGVISKYDYTIHKPVICVLALSKFKDLWQRDVGAHHDDIKLLGIIMELAESVEDVYRQLGQKNTDTLVTKVLLGTVGCLPACDTNFRKGCKKEDFPFSGLNERFVDRILRFCICKRSELSKIQPEILDLSDRPYPLMKLIDMHFFQLGVNPKSP